MTPIEKQYRQLKEQHPDALLLFRCGDFYEAYEDDAVTCANTLGIIVMHNLNGSKSTGFPHHALDTYLPKLVRAGFRIAICDQLEDPKLTKKLVKRGISEMLAATAPAEKPKHESKVKLPSITRQQYELLCECIRYRCADNDREKAEALRHGQFTQWYDDMASKLKDLKDMIYDL